MAKKECINLRISKKEKEKLRKYAEENDMNMTEYILECICLRDEEKVVMRTDLAEQLCDIAAYLDCVEIKDRRIVKELRRRFKKLWKYL